MRSFGRQLRRGQCCLPSTAPSDVGLTRAADWWWHGPPVTRSLLPALPAGGGARGPDPGDRSQRHGPRDRIPRMPRCRGNRCGTGARLQAHVCCPCCCTGSGETALWVRFVKAEVDSGCAHLLRRMEGHQNRSSIHLQSYLRMTLAHPSVQARSVISPNVCILLMVWGADL